MIRLIPGSTYLHVDQTGFTFCNLFRKTTLPWSAVEEFFVVTLKQEPGMKVHEMVGYNFVPGYEGSRIGRRFSQLIGECEGALPDKYGMKADELAEFMNDWLAAVKSAEAAEQA